MYRKKCFYLILILIPLRVNAQCEHLKQGTPEQIATGYAKIDVEMVRTVLAVFLEDAYPIKNRLSFWRPHARFVDAKRLIKPGLTDTRSDPIPEPCWEGTILANKRVSRMIAREAKKMGAWLIDSRDEHSSVFKKYAQKNRERLERVLPYKKGFYFSVILISLPRPGGGYAFALEGDDIDETALYPDHWTVRVDESTENGNSVYDLVLKQMPDGKWEVEKVPFVTGIHILATPLLITDLLKK